MPIALALIVLLGFRQGIAADLPPTQALCTAVSQVSWKVDLGKKSLQRAPAFSRSDQSTCMETLPAPAFWNARIEIRGSQGELVYSAPVVFDHLSHDHGKQPTTRPRRPVLSAFVPPSSVAAGPLAQHLYVYSRSGALVAEGVR